MEREDTHRAFVLAMQQILDNRLSGRTCSQHQPLTAPVQPSEQQQQIQPKKKEQE
jgi:hypothetical protein